jgi:hypothetical protein
VLPSGSPLESPEVIHALHVAVAAIDGQIRKNDRTSSLPDNAGKPWRDQDDDELVQSFDSGAPSRRSLRPFTGRADLSDRGW